MSFCIRSIANGSRYVPTLVANATAQGCARRLSSRPLPKHARNSAFLNEFLGYNATSSQPIDTRDDYKMSYISSEFLDITNSSTSSLNHMLDHCIDNGIHQQITNNKSYELFTQDVHPISGVTNLTNDQLVFSNNNLILYESQIPIIQREKSWNDLCYRINFTPADTFTKDKTKVSFAGVTKNAAALKESDPETEFTKKTDAEKKSQNDLEYVYEVLSVDLPLIFKKQQNFRIYHKDMEFVNNIQGKTTKGAYAYCKQIALMKIVGHLKFAHVKLDVLKITMHPQDNTVRVRWRINGVKQSMLLLTFSRLNPFKLAESMKKHEKWYDGYSIFYVGNDGLVFRHVADKMMPDEQLEEDKTKSGLRLKLASSLTFTSLS